MPVTSRLSSASRFYTFHVYKSFRGSVWPLNTAKPRATFSHATPRFNSPASDSSPNTTTPRLLIAFRKRVKPRFTRLIAFPTQAFSKYPNLASALLGGILGGFILNAQDWFIDTKIANQPADHELAALKSLEQGYDEPPPIENVILREELAGKLASCLVPAKVKHGYYTIVGEHGTGKTTLIKLILSRVEKPRGCIYVDCASNIGSNATGYIDSFKTAIGYQATANDKTNGNVGSVLFNRRDTHVSLMKTFTAAAKKYKEQHGVIPVLVIDNANRLADSEPEFLDSLQDAAKAASDSRQFTVVFVSSEGNVPARMKARSAWSRHYGTFIIGDVSQEESIKYLTDCGLHEKQCRKVYDLVGGRLVHLESAQSHLMFGFSIDMLRERVFSQMREELTKVGIKKSPKSPFNGTTEATAKIISQILAEGFIDEDQFLSTLENWDFAKRLLGSNVFSLDVMTRKITFQSTAMRNFCKEHQEVWKVNA